MNRYWGGDGVWLAVDRERHVAVFTTAGVAPIPSAVFDGYSSGSPEHSIIRLPSSSDYQLLVRYKRPNDYIDFASRGFFAYDWRDVHRTSGFSRCYELISQPTDPVTVDSLEPELARLACLVHLGDVSFLTAPSLPIQSLVACETG